MTTDSTPRRALQRLFVLAPLALLLAVNRAPAADTSADDDLKIVQGRWEREESSDSKASYRRATKDIRGNKETITYYDAGGGVVRRHNVEFSLSRMGDVKVFTYRQMEITDGPEKGTKNPGPASYVYWANDKFFREVWGFLPGQDAPPVVLYVWKRAGDDKGEATVAAAKDSPRAGATLVGRWRAVASERGGQKDADDQSRRHLVTFTTDTFRIDRDGELMMRGKYTVDASKTPATIDMTIEETSNRPEHVGKVLRGIVEQSGDTLKWAFSRPDGNDRPSAFATKVGEETMSVVLKREETK